MFYIKPERRFYVKKQTSYIKRPPLGIIEGIFLILLAISGNFFVTTLNCDLQRSLHTNWVVKQALIILIIYFSVTYTSDYPVCPTDNLKLTVKVWIIYVLMTTMSLDFTAGTIALFTLTYILDNYGDYYQQKLIETPKDDNTKILELGNKVKIFDTWRDTLFYITIVIILIGFMFYLNDSYKKYGRRFNLLYHLFGITKC